MTRFRQHPVRLTNEARVLKELRLAKGLSMRQAGGLIGKSDSYISQIENGRMHVPQGRELLQILTAYDGPTPESFHKRVQIFREKVTDKDEILELVRKMNAIESEMFLKLVRALMS